MTPPEDLPKDMNDILIWTGSNEQGRVCLYQGEDQVWSLIFINTKGEWLRVYNGVLGSLLSARPPESGEGETA